MLLNQKQMPIPQVREVEEVYSRFNFAKKAIINSPKVT